MTSTGTDIDWAMATCRFQAEIEGARAHNLAHETALEFRRLLHLQSLGVAITLRDDSLIHRYLRLLSAPPFGDIEVSSAELSPQMKAKYSKAFGFNPSYIWTEAASEFLADSEAFPGQT